jgi:GST-like protein
MIDLFYWPTPNGWKVSIALEELELSYTLRPVDITRGAQLTPEFLALNPNHRMPAIVDHAPADGGSPITVFESGAILVYLAEKSGRLGGRTPRERIEILEWVFWQMSGLGPMLGQLRHFKAYAPEPIPYAIERYQNEADRLFGVIDRQLTATGREYLAGEYSIADIASYPWARGHKVYGIDLTRFPAVAAWIERIKARPAAQRGMALGRQLVRRELDEQAKKVLFGQTADTAKRG